MYRPPGLKLLMVVAATALTLSFAQEFRDPVWAIQLDNWAWDPAYILELPAVAYLDKSCSGRSRTWIGEPSDGGFSTPANTLAHFVNEAARAGFDGKFDETCLTFPKLSRHEAGEVAATIVSRMHAMDMADLEPGRGASDYHIGSLVSVEASVLRISFQVSNGFARDAPSVSFGYLFLEYDEHDEILRLMNHRYVSMGE